MSSRKRSPPGTRRSRVHLEQLEPRLPLAGNVTAELAGTTLRLTGDQLANVLAVATAPGGRIAVIGIDTTINGGAAAFVTSRTVTAVVAGLRGGDDAIGFGNSAAGFAVATGFIDGLVSPLETEPPPRFDVAALQSTIDTAAGAGRTFSIPGGLTLATGDGDDTVWIGGTVGGTVAVDLGPAVAHNGFMIGAESSGSRIGGSLTVTGGRQADVAVLGNVTIAGGVTASLGDGTNLVLVTGGPDQGTTVGSFTCAGGAGDDIVWGLGNVVVLNDVRIATGARGTDSVGFATFDDGGGVEVRGNLVVDTGTGDDADVASLVGTFRGAVSVTTGGGNDVVSVSSAVGQVSTDGNPPVPTFGVAGPAAIGRDLAIGTGGGNDVIAIAAASVGRNATIDAGAGDDVVRIDGTSVRGSLYVRLGAGDDWLGITNLRALVAFLDGGSGTNGVATDAATRTAARWLRRERFQAVANG